MNKKYFLDKRVINWLLLGSFIFSVLSFFYEPPIPKEGELVPEIHFDPIQKPTDRKRFLFEKKGREYFVEPVFDYELWGVVVSKNGLTSFIDRYIVKDEAREYDYCVIWGKKAFSNFMDFVGVYNKNYSCNFYQKKPNFDWKNSFHIDKISNNHLLTSDKAISKIIHDVNIGDQIHLQGILVNYGPEKEGYIARKSSTNRFDSGDGACETIYVDNIEILKKSQPILSWFVKNAVHFFLFVLALRLYLYHRLQKTRKEQLKKIREKLLRKYSFNRKNLF